MLITFVENRSLEKVLVLNDFDKNTSQFSKHSQ